MARGWLPAGLTIDEVRGTVAGTLRIRNFRYRDPTLGMDLTVESAALDLAPLRTALATAACRARRNRRRVAGRCSRRPHPWPRHRRATRSLAGTARHALRRVAAGARRVAPPAGRAFPHPARQRCRAAGAAPNIEASKLTLESPDGAINLSARIGARAPKLQQLQAEFPLARGRAPVGRHAGSAPARSETLELERRARSAGQGSCRQHPCAGTYARPTGDAWRAHLSVERFDPHPLVTTDAFDTMALELDADGDLEDLALRGVLSLDKDRIHLEQLVLARRAGAAADQPLSKPGSILNPRRSPARRRWHSMAASPLPRSLPGTSSSLPEAWAGAHFVAPAKSRPPRAWNASR